MSLSDFHELQFRAPRNNQPRSFSRLSTAAYGKDNIFLFRQMLDSAPLLERISETLVKNKLVLLDVIGG